MDYRVLFAVFYLSLSFFCRAIRVANFQEDGRYSKSSYMMNAYPLADPLSNFSFCFRLKMFRLRGVSNYVMCYAHEFTDNALSANILAKDTNRLKFKICKLVRYSPKSECHVFDLAGFDYQEWTHFCFTFEKKDLPLSKVDTTMVMYMNGVENGTSTLPMYDNEFREIPKGGIMVLGQDQDSVGGKFDEGQSFSGKITEFSLWGRVITQAEISDLANCRLNSNLRGGYFDWSEAGTWVAGQDTVIEELDYVDLCKKDVLVDKFIMSETVMYDKFKPLCDRMGGTLPTPHDETELVEMHDDVARAFQLLMPASSNCQLDEKGKQVTFWTGNVLDSEARWMDAYDGQLLVNGGNASTTVTPAVLDRAERCSVVWGYTTETRECGSRFSCGVCHLKPATRIMMKGLCKRNTQVDFDYDIYYFLKGQFNGKPHFHGIMNSHIYYDTDNEAWRLQSLRNPQSYLLLEDPVGGTIPIGTHTWNVSSRAAVCGKAAGAMHELTFSICYPNKYTCNDGSCINLANRCNTEIDCADESDENTCDYLSFGQNYAKELIPREQNGTALEVNMNVSILAIPNIDTVNLKFTVDFFLTLRWYDLRIDFRDLNNISSLNILSFNDQDSIWAPQLAFVNALGPFQTEMDKLTLGELVRESGPLEEDYSTSIEAMLFSGVNNSIKLTREYYQDYACQFNLLYFPFDTQMCAMVFQVQGKTDNYVKLVKDGEGIEFIGTRHLVEYDIQKWRLNVVSSGNISQAIVKIVFRRRMEYHVLSTFIQTGILVLTGYISFHFDLDDFTNRIMVCLTSMLVVATIVSSVQETLPRTAYYKMVDWWMMFCMMMLVLTMLFHTYLNKLVRDSKKKQGFALRLENAMRNKIDNLAFLPGRSQLATSDGKSQEDSLKIPRYFNYLAQVLYIVALAVFCSIFWVVALGAYFAGADVYIDDPALF